MPRARAGPARRGRIQVPPASGIRPILMKACRKRAELRGEHDVAGEGEVGAGARRRRRGPRRPPAWACAWMRRISGLQRRSSVSQVGAGLHLGAGPARRRSRGRRRAAGWRGRRGRPRPRRARRAARRAARREGVQPVRPVERQHAVAGAGLDQQRVLGVAHAVIFPPGVGRACDADRVPCRRWPDAGRDDAFTNRLVNDFRRTGGVRAAASAAPPKRKPAGPGPAGS